MLNQKFSNNAKTTLAAPLSSEDVSMTVAANVFNAAVQTYSGFFERVTIKEDGVGIEIVDITGWSGSTATITRAVEGSTALNFTEAAIVYSSVTADWFQQVNDFIWTPTGGL